MAKQDPAKNGSKDSGAEQAQQRLASTGRNDPCPCGSGKKYKKCHLPQDESIARVPERPDPKTLVQSGWRLFEQHRPGAAEKEFRAALELEPSLTEARVGVGMAKLSSGDVKEAQTVLEQVLQAEEPQASKWQSSKVKNAFSLPEAQSYVRAAHALGCILYDDNKFEEAAAAFEKVYSIDEDAVGMEARLIAAKSLMKIQRSEDAIKVLEPAASSKVAASRGKVGLALGTFLAGRQDEARTHLRDALKANPHFGKALLGKLKKKVEMMAAAQPGSVEEAAAYAQTYGDAWTDEAKAFLTSFLSEHESPAAAAGQ